MIATPLIIWFIVPFLIGGAIGFGAGFVLAKLVRYVLKVRDLRKTKQANEELNRQIKNNFNSNNCKLINLKDFIAKEDGGVYVGKINSKTEEITDVGKVEYESIDLDLNKKLEKEGIIIW